MNYDLFNKHKKLILFIVFTSGYMPYSRSIDPATVAAIMTGGAKYFAAGFLVTTGGIVANRAFPSEQTKLATEKAKYDLAISQQDDYIKRKELQKGRIRDWDVSFPSCKEKENNSECAEYKRFRDILLAEYVELIKNGDNVGRIESKK